MHYETCLEGAYKMTQNFQLLARTIDQSCLCSPSKSIPSKGQDSKGQELTLMWSLVKSLSVYGADTFRRKG